MKYKRATTYRIQSVGDIILHQTKSQEIRIGSSIQFWSSFIVLLYYSLLIYFTIEKFYIIVSNTQCIHYFSIFIYIKQQVQPISIYYYIMST